MTKTNSSITTEEYIKKIKKLESAIQSELQLSAAEIRDIVKQNTDLINYDTKQISKCVLLANTEYNMTDYQISAVFMNQPQIFFDATNLKDKFEVLKSILNITPAQFGFVIANNPQVIKLPYDELENLINKV